jgi:hypothetical protein
VAQYAAGLVTLTPNQLVAADASGNGTVSSLDASRIAQYIVGLNPTGATGTWKFAPVNISYSATTSQVSGEDYAAILVGDVTGNWTNPPSLAELLEIGEIVPGLFEGGDAAPPSKAPAGDSSEGSVDVSFAERRNLQQGEIVRIPVRVGEVTGRNVTAFDFEVSFDPATLRPVGVDKFASLSASFSVFSNAGIEGRLKIAAFGVAPLAGRGDLIHLLFEVIGPKSGALNWENFTFNEGEVQSKTKAGAVRIRRSAR